MGLDGINQRHLGLNFLTIVVKTVQETFVTSLITSYFLASRFCVLATQSAMNEDFTKAGGSNRCRASISPIEVVSLFCLSNN